jgi:hypothetical protein
MHFDAILGWDIGDAITGRTVEDRGFVKNRCVFLNGRRATMTYPSTSKKSNSEMAMALSSEKTKKTHQC